MEEDILSKIEVLIRKSLSEENDAISAYQERSIQIKDYANSIEETNPELADKLNDVAYIINDIKNEEEVHVGELKELFDILNITSSEDKGEEEVEEKVESFKSIVSKISSLM